MKKASHLFAALAVALVAGPLQAAPITINFDEDALGNPLVAPPVFASTTRLTTLYSSLGVTFAGPGGNDGGAILNQAGNFGLNARSGENFLAYNRHSSLSDGGTPTGPQTLLFSSAITSASIYAGNGSTGTYRMEAFDALNQLVATDTQAIGGGLYVQLSVAGLGITRIVLDRISGDDEWVFDDLMFDAAEVPEPTSLALFGIGSCVVGLGALRRRRQAV